MKQNTFIQREVEAYLKGKKTEQEVINSISSSVPTYSIIQWFLANYATNNQNQTEVKTVEAKVAPITLNEEDYNKLLEFIQPKKKRNKKAK